MAETKIGWCDYTFNPWIGCQRVASGCTHCYAEAFAKRYNKAAWGPQGTRVKTSAAYWRKPHRWNGHADLAPMQGRARVFCGSLCDVFEDWEGDIHDSQGRRLWVDREHPGGYIFESAGFSFARCRPARVDDLRRDLFALIDATPHLDGLLLTKRPENVRRMWVCPDELIGEGRCEDRQCGYRRDNVWLGTSVSDQATAERNIPELLKCRDLAPVLFGSCEPLLAPIDFRIWEDQRDNALEFVDWVIVGGESGPNRRPMEIAWLESIVDQCKAAGTPCFVKQDAHARPGQQGRIPDSLWKVKEFPA